MTPIMLGKAIASIAVMAAGCYCMYLTKGSTGKGWSILGIALIWGS